MSSNLKFKKNLRALQRSFELLRSTSSGCKMDVVQRKRRALFNVSLFTVNKTLTEATGIIQYYPGMATSHSSYVAFFSVLDSIPILLACSDFADLFIFP